jgi:hypothetical protein
VRITKLTRFVNDRFDQNASEAMRAKSRTNKQSLHLAGAGAEFSQCDAAGELVVFGGE